MVKNMIIFNELASKICSKKCCGYDGYDGSCCSLENRDYIMGPITDVEEFLARLSDQFGRTVERHEVLIDYEEGRQLFPDRLTWQNPDNFPAMRVEIDTYKKQCVFYNRALKACNIYAIRPSTCEQFRCEYLKQNS